MNIAKLGFALVAGALSVTAVNTSAMAASPVTQSFLDNITPNVDFLDRSSRLALTTTKSAHIRDFARGEAAEQTMVANSFYDWTQGNKTMQVAAAPDTVVTGRSAAVDGQPVPVIDNRLPLGEEDLNSLEGLSGSEFDNDFKSKQRDALRQIETDYQTYIAKGDDPVLLGIANRELPKVQHQLGLLGKL